MGSDKSVVQRTQYFNLEKHIGKKTVQYAPYFTISSFCSAMMMIAFGLNFALMASTRCGRYLLLKVNLFQIKS